MHCKHRPQCDYITHHHSGIARRVSKPYRCASLYKLTGNWNIPGIATIKRVPKFNNSEPDLRRERRLIKRFQF